MEYVIEMILKKMAATEIDIRAKDVNAEYTPSKSVFS
jgi:hypothetical protein